MKKTRTDDIISLVFDGESIEDAIKMLTDYKDQFGEKYTKLRVDSDSVWEGGYYTYLRGERLETDREEKNRLFYEKENADRQLANEKLQYEKLKAKFKNEKS